MRSSVAVVRRGGVEGRRVPADREIRPGGQRPGDRAAAALGLGRLGGDLDRLVAGLPVRIVLLGQGEDLVRVDVADHQHLDVTRPVEPVEELAAVLVLVGHGLDVGQEAHGGVLVGVLVEGQRAQLLEQRQERPGGVLVVLAQDRQRLGAEVGLRVLEVDEPVALEVHHLLELGRRADDVVVGPVVGGEGVRVRAHLLEGVVVLLRRVLLGAPEHDVLEEVGEAAVAGLDLLARPGPDDRVVGDDARAVERDDVDHQPVVEGLLVDLVGKDAALVVLAAGRALRRGGQGRDQHEQGEERGGESRGVSKQGDSSLVVLIDGDTRVARSPRARGPGNLGGC